jgi:hypothetical protein
MLLLFWSLVDALTLWFYTSIPLLMHSFVFPRYKVSDTHALYTFSYADTKWVSAQKRSASRESMEPDMVPHSVRLSERWRSPNTLPIVAFSAERTMLREIAPESGLANHAERQLPEEHTLCLQPVVSLFAVPLDVCVD